MDIEKISTQHQDNIFHAVYQELYHASEQKVFRNEVFAFYLFAYHIEDLIKEVVSLVHRQILLNMLAATEERLVKAERKLSGVILNNFSTTKKMHNLQQLIHNSADDIADVVNQEKVKSAIELVSLYKTLMIEGIESQRNIDIINDIIFGRFTTYLNQKNASKMREIFQPMLVLWDISYDNDYPLERIVWLQHKYQTSAEFELAYHEILERLVKTSTVKRIIHLVDDVSKNNNSELLENILKNLSPQVLREVHDNLPDYGQKMIEKLRNNTLSKRAKDIYESTSIERITSEEVIAEMDKIGEDNKKLGILLYQFFHHQNDPKEIIKLYNDLILRDDDFKSKVISNTPSRQLRLIYEELVLLMLAGTNDNRHVKLGEIIYAEVKYRINEGMAQIKYAADAVDASKLWQEEFQGFDENESIAQQIKKKARQQ